MSRIAPAILAFTAFATACASSAPSLVTDAPEHTIAIAQENARIGDQTFNSRDPNALRAAVAGACADGCEHVEIRPTPNAAYAAVRTVYEAAAHNGARGMQLRAEATRVVPLAAGDGALPETSCPADVVVRETGIDVYADGKVLRPDPDCEPWGVTVCATGSEQAERRYDWAHLSERLAKVPHAFRGRVCVHMRDDTDAAVLTHLVSTIAMGAGNATTFSLRPQKKQGRLADEQITARVMEHGPNLTACYDLELPENPRPMSVVVSFVLQPDGGVAGAKILQREGTTPRFEECIINAAEAISFPSLDGGTTLQINYPFQFTPRPR